MIFRVGGKYLKVYSVSLVVASDCAEFIVKAAVRCLKSKNKMEDSEF